MEKLNCIIVEDEPLAAEILADYIAQIPFLELSGVYTDALYAMEALQQQSPQVMFLDIHLPRLRGLDFIRTLPAPPQIIITTAYRDYAVEGFELNVADYLLKPISFNRFLMAVNKLKKVNITLPVNTSPTMPDKKQLLININKKKIRIDCTDILYIESRKEYVHIVTDTQSYLTKMPLNEMETLLGKEGFLRVHRSFLVAISRIKAYGATQVEIGMHKIPVGRSYKEEVALRMGY